MRRLMGNACRPFCPGCRGACGPDCPDASAPSVKVARSRERRQGRKEIEALEDPRTDRAKIRF